MFVIGVTGGIGTGKSTVAGILHRFGLPVLDADEISREVTAPGGIAVAEVIETFGKGILEEASDDPVIDRSKLAAIVFNDHNKIDQLTEIVHRYVIEAMSQGVAEHRKAGTKAIVLDVPIPVQEGFLDLCDYVVVVWAADDVRLERLEARGISRSDARKRMAMQMTEEEYTALGHTVIRNDGSPEELYEKVLEMARRELGQRGIPIETPPFAVTDDIISQSQDSVEAFTDQGA